MEGYGSLSPLSTHARKEDMGTEGSGNLPKITPRVHNRPRLEHWPSGAIANSLCTDGCFTRSPLHVLEDSLPLGSRTRTWRASMGDC